MYRRSIPQASPHQLPTLTFERAHVLQFEDRDGPAIRDSAPQADDGNPAGAAAPARFP
jgi:hypothetical protein